VGAICDGCFENCGKLGVVTFETGSKVLRLGNNAFSGSGLISVCIPASVEIICAGCFGKCGKLGVVTFEAESQLRVIGFGGFAFCSMQSIRIPAGVEVVREDYFESREASERTALGADREEGRGALSGNWENPLDVEDFDNSAQEQVGKCLLL
jgi:hypothetical protein